MATNNAINAPLPLSASNGGTGVNNGSFTTTLGGNINTAASLTTSGANALTLTTTGVTNSTLPSGTTTLVPTTGTGASGTWGISISGNAVTATTANGLNALSALGIVVMSASGAFTNRQLTSSSGQLTFSNADGVLGNPDISISLPSLISQPITESTTARTLSTTDANSTISCSNNTGNTTITVPTNATAAIAIGAQIKIINTSGGTFLTNVVAAVGVTFLPSPFTALASVSLANTGYTVLQKISTNTWLILGYDEQYTITTTWTGIWASNQSGNITCSAVGGSVNLCIPQVLATGNTNASFITAVTNFPSYLAPPFEIIQYIPIVNNGVNAQGAIVIESSGSITIYAGAPNFSNFTANGVSAGFKGINVSYAI